MKGKDNGVIRSTDKIGRLVIPKEVRDQLGILPGEPVKMVFKDHSVIIEKYKDVCFLCGKSDENYLLIHDKKICFQCVKEIVDINNGDIK